MRSTTTKTSAKRSNSLDRSVPNQEARTTSGGSGGVKELVLSVSSINLSSSPQIFDPSVSKSPIPLYTRDAQGNVYTNLDIQDADPETSEDLHITSDHVKYINLFSILCCWCFPITGILSIVFARKTKKYYEANEMIRAKWYLNRAEWMLLLTFFFGLTLIATGFALFEVFWFNGRQSAPAGVFHTT